MKKRDATIILFAVIILLGIISFFIDAQISSFIQTIRNEQADKLLSFFTNIAVSISAFVIANIFFIQKRKRKLILPIWLSVGITTIVIFLIKSITLRQRPVAEGFPAFNSSFPSFHAAVAFALVAFFWKEYPKLKWWVLCFALLVAFSRLYFSFHYLSDLIFGGLTGFIISFFILRKVKNA